MLRYILSAAFVLAFNTQALAQSNTVKIQNEEAARIAADVLNSSAVVAEVTRATAAEGALQATIDPLVLQDPINKAHITSDVHDGNFVGVFATFGDLPPVSNPNDWAYVTTDSALPPLGIEANSGFWYVGNGAWLELRTDPDTPDTEGETLVSGTSSTTTNQTPLTDTYATYETVTLPKAGTYRVYGKLSSWANTPSNDTGGGARVQLVDATNTAVLDASYSWIVAGEPTANRDTQLIASQTVEAEITVTSPTVITLDAEYVSATQSTIYNNDEARTYLSYRQLPEKTVVTLPNPPTLEVQQFGGRYRLDANRFIGWSVAGAFDDTVTNTISSVGGNPTRVAGGFTFPFDIQLNAFHAQHYNSSSDVETCGFRMFTSTKTAGSNTVVNLDIIRDCTGIGASAICPHDYQSTINQITDFDLSLSPIIPANTVISIGVETPSITTANRYVNVLSGYISYERVEP